MTTYDSSSIEGAAPVAAVVGAPMSLGTFNRP
jgi:hypothetical protein